MEAPDKSSQIKERKCVCACVCIYICIHTVCTVSVCAYIFIYKNKGWNRLYPWDLIQRNPLTNECISLWPYTKTKTPVVCMWVRCSNRGKGIKTDILEPSGAPPTWTALLPQQDLELCVAMVAKVERVRHWESKHWDNTHTHARTHTHTHTHTLTGSCDCHLEMTQHWLCSLIYMLFK